jgi:GH35 family endo-1,4-beta-xylanase
LNDFNTSINYEILIDGCLNAGVPISAIGIQSHQHQGYWGKEKLEEVLERFEHFGLPIHFTENTLISGDIMPAHIVDLNDWQVESWPTTPEGEERQANEIEEMYRILFSHPLVEAITTWDFKDGAWLKAPSGFVREDLSRKPSYERLKKMIKEEWHTDTEVTTDADGWAVVEAFKGDYQVEAGERSVAASFTDNAEQVIRL